MDYRDLAPEQVPLALAHLQWPLAVGTGVRVVLPVGQDRAWADDTVSGAGFDVVSSVSRAGAARLRARRARTLPDTVGADMQVLVCGLNPSLVAADAGVGYAGRTNRFWTAARRAGLASRARDPLGALHDHGTGMTDLVKRATPRAGDLAVTEYRAGVERVRRLVAWLQPRVVLFVGLEGWRAAVDRAATPGPQPDGFGGAPAYVMPSTSGLNARTSVDQLVEHMRRAKLWR